METIKELQDQIAEKEAQLNEQRQETLKHTANLNKALGGLAGLDAATDRPDDTERRKKNL